MKRVRTCSPDTSGRDSLSLSQISAEHACTGTKRVRTYSPDTRGRDSPSLSQMSSESSVASVTWGSDVAYRYLSSFKQWVNKTVFFPVKDVGVQVYVSAPAPYDLTSFPGCKSCSQRLEESELLSSITAVAWRDIDSFNLKSIDRRLHLLATSVRGGITNSFTNGQSKSIMTDMVSLVRQHALCDDHNLQLNVTSPQNADDHSAISTHVDIETTVSPPNVTDTESEGEEHVEGGVRDTLVLKGVPDLCVQVHNRPHVFVLLVENKKKKKLFGTWRVAAADSQIGQLLYYLTAVQLNRLQLHLRTPGSEKAVGPLLGIYMEDDMITPVIARIMCLGSWAVKLEMGEGESLREKGIAMVVKLFHLFAASTSLNPPPSR